MDGFFNKYGRVIIIAVAICFVLLFLTPMRNVVGSSINGFAGNFANKVGESLGTVKMPDGKGIDGTWETPDGIEAGKIIKIDGTRHQILKQTGNNKFLVYAYPSFSPSVPTFNDSKKGKDDYNIYEGSDKDNYLENTWYPSLSEQLRDAIELSEIKQSSYELEGTQGKVNIESKYDTNYKGQKYNILKRHVYLPSVEDITYQTNEIVNTRDAIHSENNLYIQHAGLCGDVFVTNTGYVGGGVIPENPKFCMCPAFIVDLSKVDYELVEE